MNPPAAEPGAIHAMQDDWDREGLFYRLRRLRAAAMAQGEPGLLYGACVIPAIPVILAWLGVALGWNLA